MKEPYEKPKIMSETISLDVLLGQTCCDQMDFTMPLMGVNPFIKCGCDCQVSELIS